MLQSALAPLGSNYTVRGIPGTPDIRVGFVNLDHRGHIELNDLRDEIEDLLLLQPTRS